MLNPRINFIGCGRLGKTIAYLFNINKNAEISGILCSTPTSTFAACNFIGSGIPCNTMKELPKAEIYFITTRDDIISKICDELIEENVSGSIIVHCSGSLSSEILIKAKQAGCFVASIHPMKSFANPEENIKSFPGTYCAIEGDEYAVSVISDLFTKIGAHVFQIDKKQKHLYHVAGVMANNYIVTLHHTATQCYEQAGIDKKTATQIASMLATQALNNINAMNHEKALTGPLQRGDAKTLATHMLALSRFPLMQNLYRYLGLATLPLTNHSKSKKDAIEEVLKIAGA